ncbi:MAG: penicillin-binding protein 2 [Deltaproteobacteria bacterium]|nr:penicillin-binding protein 2 [Deltaproteobacteria bacterium]
MAASFAVLLLRLWYLQVLQGEHFRERSENNRLREVYIPPPRGLILDRHGRILVKNRPAFNVEFVKEDSPDPKQSVTVLAEVLGVAPEELLAKLDEPQKKRKRFEPKLLLKDVSRDVLARVAARRHALPGVMIGVVPTREYVYGGFAAHLLGYLGEITAAQLESPTFSGYRRGDMVGQFGLERSQEFFLQGQRGIRGIFVDASGNRVGEAYYVPDRPGHNITLTLDFDVQRAVDEALAGKKGAIVALDPRNGEVLGMASYPGFDPNLFATGISHELWQDLTGSPDKPLTNRAVQGLYHPGSVFKFIMATAALSEGITNKHEKFFCSGSFRVDRSRPFACHKRHGAVNLKDALKFSCNVFFYSVGQRLGIDRIHDYSTRFGLGRPTGLQLGPEPRGLVPSTAWKKAHFKNKADQKWYPGETPSVSIGQGALDVTPLQVARALAALVNGGVLYRPRLIKGIKAQQGAFKDEAFAEEEQGRLMVEPWVLDAVREGLLAVVNEKGGTGSRAKLPEELGVMVAGKTGTAQMRAMRGTKTLAKQYALAWFAGYAPAQQPEIVVVAVVEGVGAGGAEAAPLVAQVMEAYFRMHGQNDLSNTDNAPPLEAQTHG